MPTNYTEDVDKWLRVRSQLERGREDIQKPPIRWNYEIPEGFGLAVAAMRFHADCMRTDEESRTAIDHWLREGSFPEMSLELRWLTRVRFDPAIDFVIQMAWSRGHLGGSPEWMSIFPFPDMEADDVIRTLLGDWWMYVGSNPFFDRYFPIYRENTNSEQGGARKPTTP